MLGLKTKKNMQGLSQSGLRLWYINNITFFPVYCPSSCAPCLAPKPYLVAVCDGHDICDLPTLPVLYPPHTFQADPSSPSRFRPF